MYVPVKVQLQMGTLQLDGYIAKNYMYTGDAIGAFGIFSQRGFEGMARENQFCQSIFGKPLSFHF